MDKAKTKIGVVFILTLMAILISVFAFAKPNQQAAGVVPSNGKATVTITSNAIEVAPGVFSLGTAIDVDGRIVEGFMFVYRKENAKPPWAGGGNGKGGSTCYTFLAKGAKWKSLESWIVNPVNNQDLDSNFVFSNLAADIQKWEDKSLTNIVGDGSATNNSLIADTASTDGVNEVYFGSIADPGVIAVTIIWGIFYGPPSGRELVEWDQVYDQVDFAWSATGEAGKMDFENIATHELGHAVGMGHPDNTCIEETMYAYADYGETKKRDLNTGDTAGINALY